ncbi:HEPN domain-containing protein [Streptomyces sp. NPDC088785]|uniref:HEPN domain-containing protein n=1 Tax=Streptomyces sp. NPDC088785 TaxID=3365897 RepID=UPI0038032982
MASVRFEELSLRIGELRQYFLPERFEPTGSYEQCVHEHARAFRVLAHAEFESFIEDRVVEVIDLAVTQWQAGSEVSSVLVAALAYRESAFSMPASLADANAKRGKYPELAERIEHTRTEIYRYARHQNHGIKERNLLRMLLPVGVLESDLNTTWLSQTDAWATERGEAAHKAGKVQVQLDPRKEFLTVSKILDGFREVDEMLAAK